MTSVTQRRITRFTVWIRVGSRLYQNIEFTGACGVKPYLHIERMCQPGKVFHNSVFSQFSHLIVWPAGGGGPKKEIERKREWLISGIPIEP
jgi:hypothetical protein